MVWTTAQGREVLGYFCEKEEEIPRVIEDFIKETMSTLTIIDNKVRLIKPIGFSRLTVRENLRAPV